MKIQKNILAAAFMVCAISSVSAFANPFSGKYTVIQSDCDDTGILYKGNADAEVKADATGIRIGETFCTGECGPGTHFYFQSALEFSVGSQKVHNLGDGYDVFQGNYSADGSQFKDVMLFATTDGATPVYDGEVDIKISGDTLEIDSTMTGQPTPGPLKVCLLKKN